MPLRKMDATCSLGSCILSSCDFSLLSSYLSPTWAFSSSTKLTLFSSGSCIFYLTQEPTLETSFNFYSFVSPAWASNFYKFLSNAYGGLCLSCVQVWDLLGKCTVCLRCFPQSLCPAGVRELPGVAAGVT